MNALGTARHPERIYFGVYYHDTDGQFDLIERFNNVSCNKISYKGMLGVGFARSIANQFYNNQDYYLQIDAHTIFDNWWDYRLINELEQIRNFGIEKPVISYYLPDWIRNPDRSISLPVKTEWQQTLVWDYDHMQSIYSDVPIMKTDYVDWMSEPNHFKQHYGIAAQFIFTDGAFCKELAPDHQILFYGEEPTLALRAYSSGYSIFVTRKAHLWHKNKMLSYTDDRDRINFVSEDIDIQRKYEARKAYGLNKTKDILLGNYFGYWGATDSDKLAQYELDAKINFNEFYQNMRKISEGVLWYES